MDPVKILKRAWHILWSYRALWVFGLILALTAAGSSGGSGNNGARYSGDSSNQGYEAPLPENWREEIGKAFAEAGEGIRKSVRRRFARCWYLRRRTNRPDVDSALSSFWSCW